MYSAFKSDPSGPYLVACKLFYALKRLVNASDFVIYSAIKLHLLFYAAAPYHTFGFYTVYLLYDIIVTGNVHKSDQYREVQVTFSLLPHSSLEKR